MIKLLVVGKIKETFFKDAIKEYEKRLSKYTKLSIIEIMDKSYENEEVIKDKEGKLLLEKINDKDFVVTLDIAGIKLTSEELAKNIDTWQIKNSNIVFIIGGSYGLSSEIKKRSNYALSFSKLTFPHQLFRVMFLEQLYRSFKIMNHESYHK